MNPIDYAKDHFEEFKKQLIELSRIPSVSFDGFPPAEVKRCAEAVAQLMLESGLENVELLEIEGAHPYVYGDWLHAPGKPTLLLYAHHDVQPPGRVALWKSPPFEPQERDGRLYGRGTADDKAGIVVHTSAVASYLKTHGSLPVNVKLIIEGEEEIGSGHLETFLSKYKEKLAGDVIVLTDTGNYDTGVPTITTSLRGLVATQVEVTVMKQPLHSGLWGGPGPDPVLALSKMLAALVDEDGRIAIPEIYKKVRPLNNVERASLEKLDYPDKMYREQTGMIPTAKIVGGPDLPLKKMTRLPSISVNAIQSSSREFVSNVVNETAWAKVGIRIVPDMDPHEAMAALKKFLLAHAPWGVEVKFSGEQASDWWLTDPQGDAFKKAGDALAKAFGRETVFLGTGGSIPFVGPFAAVLGGAPALLVGLEDPYTNAHSENESLHLGDFRKSIDAAIYLYENFGA